MKRLFAVLLVLGMLITMGGCVATTPTETIPEKPGESTAAQMQFTVTVVHADGTSKEFSYETNEKMLGDYLKAQGLIGSEGADDGMFNTVDGEKADWNETQSYWAFYLGDEYAMQGIYDTPITDGAAYKLVYTPA